MGKCPGRFFSRWELPGRDLPGGNCPGGTVRCGGEREFTGHRTTKPSVNKVSGFLKVLIQEADDLKSWDSLSFLLLTETKQVPLQSTLKKYFT